MVDNNPTYVGHINNGRGKLDTIYTTVLCIDLYISMDSKT